MLDKEKLAEAARDLLLALRGKAGDNGDVDFLLSNAWLMERANLSVEGRISSPERFLLGRWLLESNLSSDQQIVSKLARFAQLLQGGVVR